MASDLSCFSRLPVELCDEILILAAWTASERDKPWLCTLTIVSKRIMLLTRQILYQTVCVTSYNVGRILATAPSGHLALTRYLWIGSGVGVTCGVILSLFPNVLHVCAGYWFLVSADITQPRLPEWVTLRSTMPYILFHRLSENLAALRYITHLRFPVTAEDHFPRPPNNTLHPALALRYVALESSTVVWNEKRLVGVTIPFFLAGPQVRRVLVCAAPDVEQLPSLSAALEEYARTHDERRVWLLQDPTEGDRVMLSGLRPGITFDSEQWLAGRPVYPASAWGRSTVPPHMCL